MIIEDQNEPTGDPQNQENQLVPPVDVEHDHELDIQIAAHNAFYLMHEVEQDEVTIDALLRATTRTTMLNIQLHVPHVLWSSAMRT